MKRGSGESPCAATNTRSGGCRLKRLVGRRTSSHFGIASALARLGGGPNGGAGTNALTGQSGGNPGGGHKTGRDARERNKRMRQTAYACSAKNKDSNTKRQCLPSEPCSNASWPIIPPMRVVQK